MKDLKQSTKQRFVGFDFDYPAADLEASIISTETGIHKADAVRLVKVGAAARALKGHGLDEGISTRLLDLLKPQDKVRVRFQEDGSELDLDVAIRSLIDLKSGNQPDTRINMRHTTNGRSIAVTLLLDLSESLNETARGSDQTVLQLSQEAVSLLAWAIEQLGDPLAIAGFHSNTRHDVRYFHLKGFGEHWGARSKRGWPRCRRATAHAWVPRCAMRPTP